MKNNSIMIKTNSIILVLVLAFMSTLFPAIAITQQNEQPVEIIESDLSEIMLNSSTNDTIPVSIWYKDIDQNVVDAQVKEKTGLSVYNIAVDLSMPSIELMNVYRRSDANANEIAEGYFSRTAPQRKLERKRTDEFINTRREVSVKQYDAMSKKIIADFGIKNDHIEFISRYAPMIIANLTTPEIKELEKDRRIQSVSYYQEPVESTCTVESVYGTANIDLTSDLFGLTGDGVKIGMFEMGGFPDSSSDELKNASITCVGEGYVYYHVTNTASILVGETSGIAKNAEIYCSNSDFENVEALLDYGVQIINVSFAWLYNETNTGASYAYSTQDKWVDHLVSHHGVTVVASAGNNGEDTEIRRVASPAMGHNVIAVGAYNDMGTALDYTDDRMYSYSSYKNSNGTSTTTGVSHS